MSSCKVNGVVYYTSITQNTVYPRNNVHALIFEDSKTGACTYIRTQKNILSKRHAIIFQHKITLIIKK